MVEQRYYCTWIKGKVEERIQPALRKTIYHLAAKVVDKTREM